MKGGGTARAPFATTGHALGGSVYVVYVLGGGGGFLKLSLFYSVSVQCIEKNNTVSHVLLHIELYNITYKMFYF